MIHLLLDLCALRQAESTLNKLRNRISNISDDGEFNKEKYDFYNDKFKEELSNDLNTANAITVLYDVLKDGELTGKTKIKLVESFDRVLDVCLIKEENEIDNDLLKYIEEKIEKRKIAKKAKDFSTADSIRDELLSKGIKLIDTREGTTYELI